MTILEENFKWHLEAFASELFIYTQRVIGKQDTPGNNQELLNKKNYKGLQNIAQNRKLHESPHETRNHDTCIVCIYHNQCCTNCNW